MRGGKGGREGGREGERERERGGGGERMERGREGRRRRIYLVRLQCIDNERGGEKERESSWSTDRLTLLPSKKDTYENIRKRYVNTIRREGGEGERGEIERERERKCEDVQEVKVGRYQVVKEGRGTTRSE